ncbi:MAG: tetratricopeptide repeat protein [Bacteroidales bacterium]|nr:tetratricopeptide repeat protein [Bacteroidales bacterium]
MSLLKFKRIFFNFSLLILVVGSVFSQSVPDSLQKLLQQCSDQERAGVLNKIANSLVFDHPMEALGYANTALELAKRWNNQEEEIKALLYIGDSYFYNNDFEKPEHYFYMALQQSKKINNKNLTALSYYYRAYNFDIQNNLAAAEENYIKAIHIYDSLENFKKVSDLSYYLAMLLDKCGRKPEALTYYKKALKIYEELSLREDAAQVYNSMGTLYYGWGNFENAITNYNRSLDVMRTIENKSGIAQALHNLGLLYSNWKYYDEALMYYQESLILEKELNQKGGIATSLVNIGIVYAELGDLESALKYYEESMALYEEINDKSGIATSLNNIGDLYSSAGQHELAIIMLQKALILEKEIADQYGIAIAFVTLSELYLKSGNPDLSTKYNDSSFALAKKINNTEVLLSVYNNYSKISEAKANYADALFYYKKYTSLNDSLFSQDLFNQLSEVKSKYELEKKDREIELLNSKDQVQRTINILALSGFTIILVVVLILFKQIKQKRKAYKTLNDQNKEILQSREELVVAKERAEESDRLKSTFLANMSHELRTPLNGILGFTDILRVEIPDDELRGMAEIVHTSGNRLHDTLNSIIDLSIIESNKMEIEQAEIHLYELINERISLFKGSASNKNLELSFEVENKNLLITSDKKVLTNLLNNLIDNAIKYTEKGSVKVLAGIVEEQSGTLLKLTVIDTGIGIEEDKAKNIFEKFRQVSEGHDRQFEGAGLGLTICKKYIEILEGEISLFSKPGEGSAFTVLIPVKARLAANEPAKPKKPVNAIPDRQVFNLLGPVSNLLIVENDEINITHLRYILQDMCNIEIARNGNEAIRLAENHKFHVVLMDINLGAGMNGMDTAKAIKKLKGYNKVPVIAVTANAMKGHKEEFLANGCSHYISKPFSSDKLRQLIMEALNDTI